MIKDMGHVRNIFCETLRLYPPVAFFPREVTCPMQMRDKQLEEGAMQEPNGTSALAVGSRTETIERYSYYRDIGFYRMHPVSDRWI